MKVSREVYKCEYDYLTKELKHSYVSFYKIFYKYGRKYTVFIENTYDDYYIMGVVSTHKFIKRNEQKEFYEVGEDWTHIQTGYDLNDKNYDKNAHELIDLTYEQFQKNEHIVKYI